MTTADLLTNIFKNIETYICRFLLAFFRHAHDPDHGQPRI